MLDKIRNAWRSRTIWFNAAILAILPFVGDMVATLPQVREFLPDDVYKAVGLVLIVGNMVLRGITSTPLEAK